MDVTNLSVTKSAVSFNLKSNINQEVKCSLFDSSGDLVTTSSISIFKSNFVKFESLRSNSAYYINCQVFSKKSKEAILTETKPFEVHTQRSFIGNVITGMVSLAIISVVLLLVLTGVKFYMDFQNNSVSLSYLLVLFNDV